MIAESRQNLIYKMGKYIRLYLYFRIDFADLMTQTAEAGWWEGTTVKRKNMEDGARER